MLISKNHRILHTLVTNRPFRAPHHNASLNALIGGGVDAMPGEVSLAHKLLEVFGEPKRIYEADFGELCKVEGIGKEKAKQILESRRKDPGSKICHGIGGARDPGHKWNGKGN